MDTDATHMTTYAFAPPTVAAWMVSLFFGISIYSMDLCEHKTNVNWFSVHQR